MAPAEAGIPSQVPGVDIAPLFCLEQPNKDLRVDHPLLKIRRLVS